LNSELPPHGQEILAILKPRPSFVFTLMILAYSSCEWPHCHSSGSSCFQMG